MCCVTGHYAEFTNHGNTYRKRGAMGRTVSGFHGGNWNISSSAGGGAVRIIGGPVGDGNS